MSVVTGAHRRLYTYTSLCISDENHNKDILIKTHTYIDDFYLLLRTTYTSNIANGNLILVSYLSEHLSMICCTSYLLDLSTDSSSLFLCTSPVLYQLVLRICGRHKCDLLRLCLVDNA